MQWRQGATVSYGYGLALNHDLTLQTRLQVLSGLSSERILTMEYMTGVGVTDIDALKREGLNPSEARPYPHSMGIDREWSEP